MSVTEAYSGFELRGSLRVLSHRRWLVVVTTAVVIAVALGLTFLQAPKYTATAKIVFVRSAAAALSPNSNSQSLNPARDIQTEIEVLTSNPVRQMVATALRVPMAPAVSASPVVDTNAVQITATSTDRRMAAQIANGYADAYLRYKSNQLTNSLQAVGQVVQGRIAGLQGQIDALSAQVAAAPPAQRPTVEASLNPQRNALISQEAALQQELDQSQVDASLADTGAQIGDRAAVPTSPSSPRPLKSAAYALVLGICIGVGLALLTEYLDDSIKSKEDAEGAASGATTLGLIPMVPGWKGDDEVRLVSLSDSTSPVAEAYRGLRTAISFLGVDQSLRLIQVTSPGAGEGKTTTLANLAIALGDAGHRVCVVSADLRRPRIHEFFSLPNERGLISVVRGESTLRGAIRRVEPTENVYLLPSGPPPSRPSELLASRKTEDVLYNLAEQFDIVLVDSPPVLPVTDAAVLSRRVDGVLLVCRTGMTKKRALTRAIEVLEQVGAPILGLVVNGAEDDIRYGYSYYGPRTSPTGGRLRRPAHRKTRRPQGVIDNGPTNWDHGPELALRRDRRRATSQSDVIARRATTTAIRTRLRDPRDAVPTARFEDADFPDGEPPATVLEADE